MQLDNYLNFSSSFNAGDSSSVMLFEVLKSKSVADAFVRKTIGLQTERPCTIYRERLIGEVGSVVTLIETRITGKDSLVLVASETDDFSSATKGRLNRYYENARDLHHGKDVYLIYVTQFTDTSIADDSGLLQPPTIEEFEQLKDHVGTSEHLSHISWLDFYAIIKICYVYLCSELVHILSLHRDWIKTKNREDIKRRLVEIA